MKLILETTVEGIATRQDGTLKLTLSTQEVDSSVGGNLLQLRGKFIKCLLSDSNITTLEEEMVDATQLVGGKKPKSKSSRLRAVFFRLHEQEKTEVKFDDWYDQKMESLIAHFKSKLD